MNNTQFVVRLDNADENFKQLEQLGVCNIQHLTKDNYNFPVIVVDLQKMQFFGTNTTCMAAMQPKILTVEELTKIDI